MGSLAKVVEDCYGVLQLYSDGTVYRAPESEIDFGDHHHHRTNDDVEWEDCLFDEQHKLYLRIYKPRNNIINGKNKVLPIVYYIHGGGFCVGSRTWPNCHNCCLTLSSQLQALVISPDYRLAPEHRLPAAIEDGINAVKWLKLQAKSREPQQTTAGLLISEEMTCTMSKLLDDIRVDFDQVFIVGDSSGGNIAHHLAVHLGPGSTQLHPVRVRGYVLLAPFFGGSLRTISEAHGLPEPILNLDALDRFWRLSLPSEKTRDHPFANPFGPISPNLEMVPLDPMLIIVGGNEILKDRVEDYAKRLRKIGKDITYVEFEGERHGFLTDNPHSDVSKKVIQLIKQFMLTRESSC